MAVTLWAAEFHCLLRCVAHRQPDAMCGMQLYPSCVVISHLKVQVSISTRLLFTLLQVNPCLSEVAIWCRLL